MVAVAVMRGGDGADTMVVVMRRVVVVVMCGGSGAFSLSLAAAFT